MKHCLAFLLLWSSVLHNIVANDLRSDTIDIRSYFLKLNLTDFTTKTLHAEAEIDIKSLQNNVNSIRLDLLRLTVDSIKFNGVATTFSYNDTLLHIHFPVSLQKNNAAILQVYYHGKPIQMNGDFGGFYWTNLYAFNIGVSFQEDPHSYGRVWFPCFDNFKQRSLFEFEITTKNIHRAFCNGILQSEISNGSNKIWTWKLNQAIPAYLASVTVSQYEVLYDSVQGLNGTIPIQLAARANDTAKVKQLFTNLPNALHIYEGLFGAYLWDRIGYCIVPFNAGAMEHATNISFMQYYLTALASDCEETMAHELSHHWFGNLVTCSTASDMWLNEGWARYCEKLFLEELYGDSVYQTSMRTLHEDVLHRTHIRDGDYFPVSGVPSLQTYGSTVYDKGADMIHTLRWYLGNPDFKYCIKEYINQFKWQNVNTAQMRDFLSQCSGKDLTNYFTNWIYTKGFTHFSIENLQKETETVGTQTRTRLKFTIRQKLNNAPNYFTNVPVKVSYFTSNSSNEYFTETIWVSESCTNHVSAYADTAKDITMVALDFDENLQDAISDFWFEIKDTGNYDFNVARAQLNVHHVNTETLVRIEHNWIRPEPMKTKIPGLHLSNRRYWTIDGTWAETSTTSTLEATAIFPYDGTDAGLDQSFFSASEDSLVVMYRPNSQSEWQLADSFSINIKSLASDKKGEAVVYNLRKGQYCLAIWNNALTDTTTADAACIFTSIQHVQPIADFKLYPNPASTLIELQMEPATFSRLNIVDITGRILVEQPIKQQESVLYVATQSLAKGMYFVVLDNINGTKSVKSLLLK